MGHPQPTTAIHVDNTTTVGIVTDAIKRQRSRAMKMRYFWLLCQEAQKNLAVKYLPGKENLGIDVLMSRTRNTSENLVR